MEEPDPENGIVIHDMSDELAELRAVLSSLSLDRSDSIRQKVWDKKLDEIAKGYSPSFIVGVTGGTGEGKSSLINSLLDIDLLPTSSQVACTAAVCEVAYHKAPLATAHIEFLTKEEWIKELQLCRADIMRCDGNNKDDACKVAWDMLLPVYPDLKQRLDRCIIEELAEDFEGAIHLSTTKTICSQGDNRKFSQLISKFMQSHDDCGPQLWPLVKTIKIHVNADFLSGGLVIVDLPGGGDVNAARNTASRNYMERCDAIWIVADVTRAVDKAVTNQYVNRFIAGRLVDTFVTLVATKCEQSAAEYDGKQPSAELVPLNRNLAQVMTSIEGLKAQLDSLENSNHTDAPRSNDAKGGLSFNNKLRQYERPRSRVYPKSRHPNLTDPPPHLSSQDRSLFAEISRKIDHYQERREHLRRKIQNIQINNRNTFVINRWRERVKDVVQAEEPTAAIGVEAFCVSALEHVKFLAEERNTVFDDISQTGIDDLRYHAMIQTADLRNLAERRYAARIRSLLDSVSSYLNVVVITDRQMGLCLKVTDQVTALNPCLTALVKYHCVAMRNTLRRVEHCFPRGCRKAVDDADFVHENFYATVKGNTYTATMHRNGEWRQININEELVRPIFHALVTTCQRKMYLYRWDASMQTELRKYLQVLSDDIISEINKAVERIVKQAPDPSVLRLSRVARDDTFIHDFCDRAVGTLERGRKKILFGLFATMQKLLEDKYQLTYRQMGKGRYQGMTTILGEYLSCNKKHLFNTVTQVTLEELDKLCAKLESKLLMDIEELVKGIEVAYDPLYLEVMLPQDEKHRREMLMDMCHSLYARLESYDAELHSPPQNGDRSDMQVEQHHDASVVKRENFQEDGDDDMYT